MSRSTSSFRLLKKVRKWTTSHLLAPADLEQRKSSYVLSITRTSTKGTTTASTLTMQPRNKFSNSRRDFLMLLKGRNMVSNYFWDTASENNCEIVYGYWILGIHCADSIRHVANTLSFMWDRLLHSLRV